MRPVERPIAEFAGQVHRCRFPGCEIPLPIHIHACRPHWKRLPWRTRNGIKIATDRHLADPWNPDLEEDLQKALRAAAVSWSPFDEPLHICPVCNVGMPESQARNHEEVLHP